MDNSSVIFIIIVVVFLLFCLSASGSSKSKSEQLFPARVTKVRIGYIIVEGKSLISGRKFELVLDKPSGKRYHVGDYVSVQRSLLDPVNAERYQHN